jgi:hypothetical protein
LAGDRCPWSEHLFLLADSFGSMSKVLFLRTKGLFLRTKGLFPKTKALRLESKALRLESKRLFVGPQRLFRNRTARSTRTSEGSEVNLASRISLAGKDASSLDGGVRAPSDHILVKMKASKFAFEVTMVKVIT